MRYEWCCLAGAGYVGGHNPADSGHANAVVDALGPVDELMLGGTRMVGYAVAHAGAHQ